MTDDEPHPAASHAAVAQPRHTGRFWFDFAAAGAAIFISVVSLVVAISGEHTQRELLAANAWPFLQAATSRSPSVGTDEITIRNQGVGPARVFTFEVSFDGRTLRDTTDLLVRCCGLSTDPAAQRRQLSGGLADGDIADNVLRPNDQITMLRLKTSDPDNPVFMRFDRNIDRIRFEACYCSILDRCWTSNLKDLVPTQVRACPVSRHPFEAAD